MRILEAKTEVELALSVLHPHLLFDQHNLGLKIPLIAVPLVEVLLDQFGGAFLGSELDTEFLL
jgi:hypothetical protein